MLNMFRRSAAAGPYSRWGWKRSAVHPFGRHWRWSMPWSRCSLSRAAIMREVPLQRNLQRVIVAGEDGVYRVECLVALVRTILVYHRGIAGGHCDPRIGRSERPTGAWLMSTSPIRWTWVLPTYASSEKMPNGSWSWKLSDYCWSYGVWKCGEVARISCAA